ncbi:RagB/SusD family nutrient uptake outer membrane protein [Prolixibacteraceae bacterium JC049]|nr:RagB/SusD family nutrient uptake outer membrane protein [Prolixibacteraceae bacterium JC049]
MIRIKNIFIGLVILGFLAGCTESLDRFPLNDMTEAAFFKKPADFEKFANYFYTRMPSWSYADNESDITRSTGFNAVSNGTNQVPDNDNFWKDRYSTLRDINYLLDQCEKYEDKESIAKYKAEALFFRAFEHFRLVSRYGGVPVSTKVLDVNSEELFAPRNTRDEVFALIIKDLESAIAVLPTQSNISDSDYGRISKGAAQALLARVCLYEGTWKKFRGEDGNSLLQKALKASDEVIKSNNYTLFSREDLGDDWFSYLFTLDDNVQTNPKSLNEAINKEFILVNKYDFNLRKSPGAIYGNRVSSRLCPTKKLADMFLCADGLPVSKSNLFEGYGQLDSEFKNRDIRMSHLFQIPKKQYWGAGEQWGRDWSKPESELGDPTTSGGWIYFGQADFGSRTSTGYNHHKFCPYSTKSGFGIDFPIIRLPEVLLTYAEAAYELNGTITDAQLDYSINKLRDRVNLPHLTVAFANANGLNMREEIRRERTVELYMEDFRSNDLKRWYMAHLELNKPMRGIKYTGTEWETFQHTKNITIPTDSEGFLVLEDESTRKFNKDKNYLFPIPANQLVANPNLKQNPGWN